MNQRTSLLRASVFALALAIAALAFAPMLHGLVRASAVSYCDDGEEFLGGGSSTNAVHEIEYDYRVSHEEAYMIFDTFPSYGMPTDTHPNACTAVAGGNIVGFYDRTCPNLMEGFEPGFVQNGHYLYWPDLGFPQIKQTIDELYRLMGVNETEAGATKEECLNGIRGFVEDHGYAISYTSMYKNKATVDLAKVRTMTAENKVGIIFCSYYNFVTSIYHDESGKLTRVYQYNRDAAHAMMVLGYVQYDYYKNNKLILTETFLQVDSGYGGGEQGYLRLDDHLKIDDAYVVSIS